jgi:hypothetical protein
MFLSILAIFVFTSACATRTVGMQAPLAHDYDGIQWRPLDGTITQRIIVAPGYTAVVENDPQTDPETLIDRILRLPDDVRSAHMEKIRLAVRTAPDAEFDSRLDIELAIVGDEAPPLRWSYDEIRFEDDWAVIEIPQHILAGKIVEVSLEAGAGWEYGITLDRMPYGGFVALAGPEDQPLRGSLGFQTVFSQSTDRSSMIEEDIWPSVRAVATDPLLIALYVIIIGTGGGFVWRFWRGSGAA